MNRVLCALATLGVSLAIANSAAAIGRDDIIVGTSAGIGNGSIKTLNGTTLATISSRDGSGGSIAAVGYQRGLDAVAYLVNVGSNGNFASAQANNLGSFIAAPNGIGQPGTTLTVFDDDRVFFGTGTGISNQIRNPLFTGIVNGPANLGDGPIADSALKSNGDLVFLFSASSLAPDIRGRLSLATGGNMAITPNVGLGATGAGDSVLGVAVDLQSDDTIVLATDDRVLKRFNGTTLSTIGSPTAVFGGNILDIGIFADNSVAVLTDDAGGEIQILSPDLQTILGGAAGLGPLTAMAIQTDDDIIVGDANGVVQIFSRSFALKAGPVDLGNGAITALAIAVPEPACGVLVIAAVLGLCQRRHGVHRRLV